MYILFACVLTRHTLTVKIYGLHYACSLVLTFKFCLFNHLIAHFAFKIYIERRESETASKYKADFRIRLTHVENANKLLGNRWVKRVMCYVLELHCVRDDRLIVPEIALIQTHLPL